MFLKSLRVSALVLLAFEKSKRPIIEIKRTPTIGRTIINIFFVFGPEDFGCLLLPLLPLQCEPFFLSTPVRLLYNFFFLSLILVSFKFCFCCSQGRIRTSTYGSKGRCPAIRRPERKCEYYCNFQYTNNI